MLVAVVPVVAVWGWFHCRAGKRYLVVASPLDVPLELMLGPGPLRFFVFDSGSNHRE